MKTYLIEDREDLTDWFAKVHLMGEEFYPITIQVFKGAWKHRSLEASALSHVWYREISKQGKQQTAEEVKRECKLTCGVPILRAESPTFCAMYDKVVKGHDYPTKLEMMDFLPVTSLMNKEQMSDYLEAVQYKYTEQGFHLTVKRD